MRPPTPETRAANQMSAHSRLWLPVLEIESIISLLATVSDMQLNLVHRFIVERIFLLPVCSGEAEPGYFMSQHGALCDPYGTSLWHLGQS